MTTTVLAYFPSPPRGVWHLGPVPIRAYALFIIVGIVAALLIGDRRWTARGGERGVIYDIALWAVPFGLIGGRLYHLATDWRAYFAEGGAGWDAALRIWDGGLGIWGAVALGGVGAWVGCRRRGIPLPAFGDAIAPGIVLAQAVGRLGNYFNQELFGRETTMPWGLEIFYRRDPAGFVDVHSLDGVSTGQLAMVVQPTFLYELLWNLVVFAVLIYVDRRFTMGHGRLFALYVAGYCVGRFCIELLRDDTATHIAGIRINSFTSTFVFIGAVVYLILAPKGREDPATLGGPAPAAPEAAPEPTAELVSAAAAMGTPTAAGIAAAVGAADQATTTASPEPGVGTEAIATAAEEAEQPEVERAEAIAVVGAAAEDAEAPAVSDSAEPVADKAEAQEPESEEAVAAEPAVDEVGAAEPEPEELVVDEAEAAEPEPEEVEAEEPEKPAAAEPDVEEPEAAAVDEVAAQEPEPEELVVDEAEAAEPEPEEAQAEEAAAQEPEPEEAVAAEPAVDEVGAAEPEPEEAVVDEAEAAEPEPEEAQADEPEPEEAAAADESAEPVAAEPEAGAPQAEDPAPKAPDPEEPAAQLPEQPSPGESVGRWRSRLSRLRRRSGQ